MTCGTCRYFATPIEEDGTCFAVSSPRPLFEDIRAADAACSSYQPCELVQLRATPAKPAARPVYADPLDMLSQETRGKLRRTTPRQWQED